MFPTSFISRNDQSIALARQAVAWYRNRPADYLAVAANRFLLAQSLYVAEQWTEASAIVSTRMLEQVPSEPGGTAELRRAQLAALLGQREQAVALLRDAFARGLSMSAGLHRQMDLESLRGFSPFDDLMKPKH